MMKKKNQRLIYKYKYYCLSLSRSIFKNLHDLHMLQNAQIAYMYNVYEHIYMFYTDQHKHLRQPIHALVCILIFLSSKGISFGYLTSTQKSQKIWYYTYLSIKLSLSNNILIHGNNEYIQELTCKNKIIHTMISSHIVNKYKGKI